MKYQLHTLKRNLSIFGMLIVLTSVLGLKGWGQNYTKITSLAELTDGYYVVAYGTTFAMNNTNAGSYFANTAITPTGTTISAPPAALVWKIAANGTYGGRTIFNETSATYVSFTGSSNAAQAVASVTSGSQCWTFAWTGTLFTITNVVSTTRLLQYNTGSPRFACYTGSQQNITLYKLAGPTITVTGTFGAFATIVGTPSASQSVTVAGSSLTSTIEVPALSGYEFSTDNTNWSSTLSLLSSYNGSVYARLTGASVGTYNGNVSFTSTGATQIDKAVLGTVNSLTPTINAIGTFSAFSTTSGTPSASQSLAVSGANLTSTIEISAVTGYEYSTTNAIPWTSTLSLASSFNGTVYVRLTGASVGTPSGTISFTSTGATQVDKSVTGSVVPVINITGSFTAFTTSLGTPSTSQSVTLSGSGLSANINVAALTGFEYSTTNADPWTSSLSLTSDFNGSVYVRLIGAGVGSFGGNISFTSTGATQVDKAVSGTVNCAAASFPFVENFEYTPATTLSSNCWTVHSAGANPITISAGTINFPGYLSSGVGNEISLLTGAGEDLNRTFTAQTSGIVYASFLVNVSSATAAGDYFFHLGQTIIGTTFRGRIFVKNDGSNNLAFGIAQSTATANYTAFSYALNTTYLVVLKFNMVSGTTNDVASIYINPVLNSVEPSSGWITNTDAAGTDLTEVGSVAVRQGGAATDPALKLDGIRISTNWADIVGSPLAEPTNHATGFTAGTTTTTTIPLTWTDAVAGTQAPQNYLIKAAVAPAVPTAPVDGTPEVNSALVQNVAFGAQAYTFTGLTSNTTYNFAIWPYTNTGAAIDYKTSPSAPATSGTTAGVVTENFVLYSAADATSNYSSWLSGTNPGCGFGTWNLWTGGNAGFFLGDPAAAGITGMSNPAFALYANPASGNSANADRTFVSPLGIGSTLSLDWGVNFDANGIGNKGINLYTGGFGGTQIVNINMGGTSAITINGNPLFNNYGTQKMTLYFEYVSAGNLRVHGIGRDGSESYDQTIAVAGPPDAIRFYASNLDAGDQRQPYFNNLKIETDPTVFPLLSSVSVKGCVTLPVDLAIENMTIEAGNYLQIAPGKNLTINGTLTNSAGNTGLVIKSDATGTGSLITASSVPATVERYLTPSVWHLISAPVSGQDITTLVDASPFATNTPKIGLAPYDNTIPNWVPYTTSTYLTAGNFVTAKGYEAMLTSASALSFKGNLVTTDQTIAATTSASNWNVVGNPYSSAINAANVANDFLSANTAVFQSGYTALYVWDATNGIYHIINNLAGASYIPVGQAFFINTVNGGGSVNFTAAMRAHSTAAYNKSGQNAYPLIDLKATIADKNRSTQVYFVPGTTAGVDEGYDAGMFGAGNSDQAVYTAIEGSNINFALQSLPESYDNLVIPVGLNAPQGSVVSFTIDANNLLGNVLVYLEDKATGTFTRLDKSGTSYQVTMAAACSGTGRFYLHTADLTVGNNPLTENVYTIIPQQNQHKIIVLGKITSPATAMIYDLSGRLMGTTTLHSGMENEITFAPATNGIYLLKIQNGSTIINRKINWVK